MNPHEIASDVITFLSPYLLKTGEAVAMKAGGALWKKIGAIHQAVVSRFKQEEDPYPAQVFNSFEKNPDKRKEALREVLTEIVENDKPFADTLSRLLEQARVQSVRAGPEFITNVFGGEVAQIINADQINEITINKGQKQSEHDP